MQALKVMGAKAKVNPEPQDKRDSSSGGEMIQDMSDGFPAIDWSMKDDVYLTSLAGTKVKIADLCKDKKVVFIFLRRFECQTCLTYVILFAHLQPILKKGNIRVVFITCHKDLSEVNSFLVSFGFWLRKIMNDSSRHQSHWEDPELESISGAFPGELYLDPDRISYSFFGIGNHLNPKQLNFIVRMCWYWWATGILRKKPPRNLDKVGRRRLYIDTRRILWGKTFFTMGTDPATWAQSPGIIVAENERVLYRFVCKDQFNIVPGSTEKLGDAIACPLPESELLDEAVTQGLRDFAKAINNMQDSGRVQNEEMKILKRLGQGRESEVYSCLWAGMRVAVKFFKLDEDEEEDSPVVYGAKTKISEGLKSFANEAAILMSLRHNNVIQFVGFGNRPPRYFLITELMARGTLYGILSQPSINLDADRRKSFLSGTASGLQYLHSCKPPIIHQDLKSLNILVHENWSVKVSDFGIARVLRKQTKKRKRRRKAQSTTAKPSAAPIGSGSVATALASKAGENAAVPAGATSNAGKWLSNGTAAGVVSDPTNDYESSEDEDEDAHGGTVQWMSPEQIEGKTPTTKMDVFAFGVVMWEVATRKTPWRGVPHKTIQESILEGKRLPLPAFGWNKPFQTLLESCWATNPRTRPEFDRILKELPKITVPTD
ncbi:copper transport protein ctr1 [Phlyctochytrium bullatum]|nr:copper transport protein ctr1 [Phlyctochytrium bullatum]